MTTPGGPAPPRATWVRRAYTWAELARYRIEYARRLPPLLRSAEAGRRVRLTRDERAEVRGYWARFGVGPVSLAWYRLFKALNGRVDPRYIPEETFRTRLEPRLCRRDVSAAYHDKNQADRLFADLRRPRTVARNIYGRYHDLEYRPIERRRVLASLAEHAGPLFLKPAISGTGSGRNVERVTCGTGGIRVGEELWSIDDVERVYVQDFLVQEAVAQHEELARFHPMSLNTLRLITLRLHGAVMPVAATLRMGNGRPVDNGHAGGLLCGVDLGSGALTPFACDVSFRRHERHPLSGEAFAGAVVPGFESVKRAACSVHERLFYFDVVSTDIAVLPDGAPCLVEVNTFGQGIEPHQFLKGAPLFGDATDDVLGVVAARARAGWNL